MVAKVGSGGLSICISEEAHFRSIWVDHWRIPSRVTRSARNTPCAAASGRFPGKNRRDRRQSARECSVLRGTRRAGGNFARGCSVPRGTRHARRLTAASPQNSEGSATSPPMSAPFCAAHVAPAAIPPAVAPFPAEPVRRGASRRPPGRNRRARRQFCPRLVRSPRNTPCAAASGGLPGKNRRDRRQFRPWVLRSVRQTSRRRQFRPRLLRCPRNTSHAAPHGALPAKRRRARRQCCPRLLRSPRNTSLGGIGGNSARECSVPRRSEDTSAATPPAGGPPRAEAQRSRDSEIAFVATSPHGTCRDACRPSPSFSGAAVAARRQPRSHVALAARNVSRRITCRCLPCQSDHMTRNSSSWR